MPNWCVGNLKVRGTSENLVRFFKEGIYAYPEDKEPVLNCDDEGLFSVNFKHNTYVGVRGIARNEILSKEIDVYENGDTPIAWFKLEVAWEIDSEQLKEIAEKYNVDLRIHAFEAGMEFEQIIEVHSGTIVCDERINYDDKSWAWECVNPNWGG